MIQWPNSFKNVFSSKISSYYHKDDRKFTRNRCPASKHCVLDNAGNGDFMCVLDTPMSVEGYFAKEMIAAKE